MINVNEVKELIGLYKSQLYKDFYAVDVIVERSGLLFKIRCPYNTELKAQQTMNAITEKKQQNIVKPDYRPYVWIMVESNKVRKR